MRTYFKKSEQCSDLGGWVCRNKSEHRSDFKNMYIFSDVPLVSTIFDK